MSKTKHNKNRPIYISILILVVLILISLVITNLVCFAVFYCFGWDYKILYGIGIWIILYGINLLIKRVKD